MRFAIGVSGIEYLLHGTVRRLHVLGRDDQRQLSHERRRANFLAQRLEQQLRGGVAGLIHVGVGVALVPHDCVGESGDLAGQVGVQIEGDHNRYVAGDGSGHLENRPVTVVGSAGAHRTVQRQQQTVQRPFIIEPPADDR